jgi:hypothetical protein
MCFHLSSGPCTPHPCLLEHSVIERTKKVLVNFNNGEFFLSTSEISDRAG